MTMTAKEHIDESLLLDRQVCFPLYAASNLLGRLYHPVLSKLGLTYPQYLVMLLLWEHGPMTVGGVGERLHLDSGTLTPLLKRMEQAGLISRDRDPDDQRRVILRLTSQGRALKKRAVAVPATLGTGLDPSDTDIDTLRDQVKCLVRILAGKVQS